MNETTHPKPENPEVRIPSPPLVLPYGTSANRSHLGWVIVATLFQIVWVTFLSFRALDWDWPKNVLKDSVSYLLSATPSLVVAAASIRVWLRDLRAGRNSAVIVLCICFSLFLASVMLYSWVTDLLLDPHGRWMPL